MNVLRKRIIKRSSSALLVTTTCIRTVSIGMCVCHFLSENKEQPKIKQVLRNLATASEVYIRGPKSFCIPHLAVKSRLMAKVWRLLASAH